MRKQLAAAINADRRLLKLLDQQLEELLRVEPELALELVDPDRRQPFVYVTEGADGLPGIPLVQASNGFQNPNFGYIRMQSDAAFVATHAYACASVLQSPIGQALRQDFLDVPLFSSSGDNPLHFRLYDESSNRSVSLISNAQNAARDVAVPAEVFGSVNPVFSGGLELSAESVFPRNAVVRVEAYARDSSGATPAAAVERAYFMLLGYKVFGG